MVNFTPNNPAAFAPKTGEDNALHAKTASILDQDVAEALAFQKQDPRVAERHIKPALEIITSKSYIPKD